MVLTKSATAAAPEMPILRLVFARWLQVEVGVCFGLEKCTVEAGPD